MERVQELYMIETPRNPEIPDALRNRIPAAIKTLPSGVIAYLGTLPRLEMSSFGNGAHTNCSLTDEMHKEEAHKRDYIQHKANAIFQFVKQFSICQQQSPWRG